MARAKTRKLIQRLVDELGNREFQYDEANEERTCLSCDGGRKEDGLFLAHRDDCTYVSTMTDAGEFLGGKMR